ncbi:MAG: hypothetical protein K5695_17195 [Oscillospiraceae bacterium]|nr:hypothetical protein [Oscillospiraceae bacterium]
MRTKALCILAVLTALCLTACSAKKQDSVPEQPTAPATEVAETTAPLTEPESAAAETETETIPEATEALETIEPAATESTGSGNAEELPVEFFFDKKEEKENLGCVTLAYSENGVLFRIGETTETDCKLYVRMEEDDGYSEYPLAAYDGGMQAELPLLADDMAEARVVKTVGDEESFNTYYLMRSPITDKGYLYSFTYSNAYTTNPEGVTGASYVFMEDDTTYTNGDLVSCAPATRVICDKADNYTGEIYMAFGNVDPDLSWYRYDGSTWTKLETTVKDERAAEGGYTLLTNIQGDGLYVVLGKQSS